LREQAATYQAEAATHDVTEARFRLLRDVKKTWWALFYLDRALEIIVVNQNLLRQFVKIARKFKALKLMTGSGKVPTCDGMAAMASERA
jgi:hypothetical protein